MKKLIILFSIVLLSALAVYASGVYQGERTNGINKNCYYSDGSVITVSAGEVCPMSN